MPHVNFEIIGGYCGDVSAQNVSYHGWIDDIGPMIEKATVIVRPTRHDGMPLMVLEALARGRYVVWSHPLEGAFEARNADDIVDYLSKLHDAHVQGNLQINEPGLRAVEQSFSPAAVTQSVEEFLDDLASETEGRREMLSVSRRRAVASGDPQSVAVFFEKIAREAPEWDVHALIGRSRSERVDDILAMIAADRWFKLGNDSLDPVVARLGYATGKRPIRMKLTPGKPLNGELHARRQAHRIKLTTTEWRAFDAYHAAPTFFARPAWGLALEQTMNGLTAEPMLFRLPEGEALFPLMRSRGRRFVCVQAMPLGTYTLPICPDGQAADPALAEAIVHDIIRRDSADFSCTLWPMAGYGDLNGCHRTVHQASVIDLRDGADAAVSRFKGVARRMAGQAVRKGVTCGREPDSAELYYGLLEEAAKRWGMEAPHLPLRLFQAIVAFGGEDVEIWIGRYKGEAIAGAIVLYGSSESFVWSAAMRAKYADLRPMNLLHVEMIKAACERGLAWYNLGASEGLGGVARFKESLGAELVDYPTLSWRSSLYDRYSKLRSVFDRNRAQPAKAPRTTSTGTSNEPLVEASDDCAASVSAQ
jgi:hypothetical protein